MAALDPKTRLQRVPELELDLDADGSVRLRWEGKRLRVGVHALAILDLFRRPLSFAAATNHLGAAGPADWVELSGTIKQLFDAGVLRDVDGPAPEPEAAPGFGRPAGTGVLAMAVARAGAAHVHAIETNAAIARIARSTFARNGVADRITLHETRSTQVELPRRADVLVSEIIGNEPFGEGILQLTADAVARLLEPEARLVPSGLEAYGLAVTIPDSVRARQVVTAEALAAWQNDYGLDFTPLAEMSLPADRPLLRVRPQAAAGWPVLADPVLLARIDLARIGDQRVDATLTGTAREAGLLNGFLLYFETTLSPRTRLSTHPAKAGDSNHWQSPVWGSFPPLEVRAGDTFCVHYRSNVRGAGPRVRVWKGAG